MPGLSSSRCQPISLPQNVQTRFTLPDGKSRFTPPHFSLMYIGFYLCGPKSTPGTCPLCRSKQQANQMSLSYSLTPTAALSGVRGFVLLSPFYGQGYAGSGRLSNLPKATQLVSDERDLPPTTTCSDSVAGRPFLSQMQPSQEG